MTRIKKIDYNVENFILGFVMLDFKTIFKARQKAQRFLNGVAFFLELILAIVVIFIILMQIISLGKLFYSHVLDPNVTVQYTSFLKEALGIIIGVEFLKMLCQHSMNSVIDVLLFVLARHLIVMESTMFEGLLCIISVAILFSVRKFLVIKREKNDVDSKEVIPSDKK